MLFQNYIYFNYIYFKFGKKFKNIVSLFVCGMYIWGQRNSWWWSVAFATTVNKESKIMVIATDGIANEVMLIQIEDVRWLQLL